MDLINKRIFMDILDEFSQKETEYKNEYIENNLNDLIITKLNKYNIKNIDWEMLKEMEADTSLYSKVEKIINNEAIKQFRNIISQIEKQYDIDLYKADFIPEEDIIEDYYEINIDIIEFLKEKGIITEEDIEEYELDYFEDTIKNQNITPSDIEQEIEVFLNVFGFDNDIEFFLNIYETLDRKNKEKVIERIVDIYNMFSNIPEIDIFITETIRQKLNDFENKILNYLKNENKLTDKIVNKIKQIFENIEIYSNYKNTSIDTVPFSNFDLEKEWQWNELQNFLEYYEDELELNKKTEIEIENIKVSYDIKNIIGKTVLDGLKEKTLDEPFDFIEKNKDLNAYNNTVVISKSKLKNAEELLKHLEEENGKVKEIISTNEGDIVIFKNKTYLINQKQNIMEIEQINKKGKNISYKIPKYIRQLLINIGNYVFRKQNEENLFTYINKNNPSTKELKEEISKIFPEAKRLEISFNGENITTGFNYKKFLNGIKKEIEEIYNNKEKKEIVLNSSDPLFELFLLNVKKALKNGKKVVLTDIRTLTELNGVFNNLDKKYTEYFDNLEDKYNVKGYMLISTKNHKPVEKYNKEAIKEIIFEATQNEKDIQWIIEQIKKKKLAPSLEELNTIITLIKANLNIRADANYNAYSSTAEEIGVITEEMYSDKFNSERIDRNYLINEVKKLKNNIEKNDVILLGGLSGVGKDTILEMITKIDDYNIDNIDMTKVEYEIKKAIEQLYYIKKKENMSHEEFLEYIVSQMDKDIQEGAKFWTNIDTMKKIYFKLMDNMEKNLQENHELKQS